ncbi:MAG: hypothetical protein KGJ77_12350, partial [Acidobacteriota bacterium]|nr:hypothetical protein [Acidobacteriota bacterium]
APSDPASAPATAPAAPPPPAPAPAGVAAGALPSRDALVQAWGDGLLTKLSNRARARFRVGRFLAVDEGTAVFALPNETHRSYCEEVRHEVEQVLAGHFGAPVPMRLVVDEEGGEADRRRRSGGPAQAEAAEVPGAADDEAALLDPEVLAAETDPAGSGPSAEERLKQIFPGAQEL